MPTAVEAVEEERDVSTGIEEVADDRDVLRGVKDVLSEKRHKVHRVEAHYTADGGVRIVMYFRRDVKTDNAVLAQAIANYLVPDAEFYCQGNAGPFVMVYYNGPTATVNIMIGSVDPLSGLSYYGQPEHKTVTAIVKMNPKQES